MTNEMSGEARELDLYIANEEWLYNGLLVVNASLARKWVKGTFSRDLAPKAYLNLVTSAAKQYKLEFGTMSDSLSSLFPTSARREVCEALVADFLATVRQPEVWGDLGEHAAAILTKGQKA